MATPIPSAEISYSLLVGGFRITAFAVVVGELITADEVVGVGEEFTTLGVLEVIAGEAFAWVEGFLELLQPMIISKTLAAIIILVGFIALLKHLYCWCQEGLMLVDKADAEKLW